jgi:flagellar biosynthesis protein FlhF
MKIKRFFAKDIRKVINDVREQLGPDAVILSNQKVSGGVEIVAAVDYDESIMGSFATQEPYHHQREAEPEAIQENETITSQADQLSEDVVDISSARIAEQNSQPEQTKAPEAPVLEWSQEPTLVSMRQELNSLRGLLENQLSGFAWGDMSRRQPLRAKLLQKLLELGLSTSLARKLADQSSAANEKDFDMLWRKTLGLLAKQIPLIEDDLVETGGVIALIGPTGVGKTTTIAKLAARAVLKNGNRNIALVTTDSYRVGAHEQLKIYGRILDIPVRIANDKHELKNVLASLQDKHLVLIDTAGMSQRDMRLAQQLSMIAESSSVVRNFLVLSSITQNTALNETIKAFSEVPLSGSILTKLDEATSLGSCIASIMEHNLPIAYVTDGQRVPEDLRLARANNLVARATTLAKDHQQRLEDDMLALVVGDTKANADG